MFRVYRNNLCTLSTTNLKYIMRTIKVYRVIDARYLFSDVCFKYQHALVYVARDFI